MTKAEKFYKLIKDFFALDTVEETPEKLGANFAEWLTAKIDGTATDENTPEMVMAELSTATGLSMEELDMMKNGPQVCPPVDSVQKFAEFFAVDLSEVVGALTADGCDIPEMVEDEPATDEAAAEPDTDWEDLEKAIADVKAMEQTHAAAITAKDAEIAELKKTIEAQKTEIQTLSAEPAAVAVDMSKKVEPAKMTQAERMADAWARIKAQRNGN